MSRKIYKKTLAEVPDVIRQNRWQSVEVYKEDLMVINLNASDNQLLDHSHTPVGLNGFSVIIAYSGECTIYVNYIPYHLQGGNKFFVLQERHLISGIKMSKDFIGYHIISQWDFTHTAVGNNIALMQKNFDMDSLFSIITSDEESFVRLKD